MVASQQIGLTKGFADFSLLPLLLRAVVPPQRFQQPERPLVWSYYLSLESGINIDHFEASDMPEDMSFGFGDYMAEDVWQLAHRLDFITRDDLLSPVALSLLERLWSDTTDMTLRETLATQIKTHYRGPLNLSIVELLQESARRLVNRDSPWSSYSPGLLLIEIQYLLELGHNIFADHTAEQPQLLAARRDEALAAADMQVPDPGVSDFQNTIEHADAVADFYLSNLLPVGRQGMTVTEVRATAMLFTYSGLLTELYLLGPVQCLAVPEGE